MPYQIYTTTICGRKKIPMPSQKRSISTNFLFVPLLLVIIS
nr:unnamed protein product [Callosobruchus chinensis]